MMKDKRNTMYKRSKEKIVAGVIGGISRAIGIPKFIGRLAFVILTCTTGMVPGILLYLLGYILADGEE